MKIFDPIHNFIEFNSVEQTLLQHPLLERLRHIYQLGPAFHIYPGATHSRFIHTIGVMHVASLLFDHVAHTVFCSDDILYHRQLVRIAALLHDVGHFPLSHTAELFLPKHETIVEKVFDGTILDSIFFEVAHLYQKEFNQTKELIKNIALGLPSKHPFLTQLIAHPFFGADRIDYLLRDSLFTGLSYGKIDLHQLIQSIYMDSNLELKVHKSGIPSCEALLLARHWMHERVYQHPKVRALGYHYACVITDVLRRREALDDLDVFVKINDHTIFNALEDYPEHKEAIYNPNKRIRAVKFPIKEIENYNQKSEEEVLVIDIPKKRICQSFEGTRIRIEDEECFWVYQKC